MHWAPLRAATSAKQVRRKKKPQSSIRLEAFIEAELLGRATGRPRLISPGLARLHHFVVFDFFCEDPSSSRHHHVSNGLEFVTDSLAELIVRSRSCFHAIHTSTRPTAELQRAELIVCMGASVQFLKSTVCACAPVTGSVKFIALFQVTADFEKVVFFIYITLCCQCNEFLDRTDKPNWQAELNVCSGLYARSGGEARARGQLRHRRRSFTSRPFASLHHRTHVINSLENLFYQDKSYFKTNKFVTKRLTVTKMEKIYIEKVKSGRAVDTSQTSRYLQVSMRVRVCARAVLATDRCML
ncbi:hypothetical protein J6590_013010 [Homalodisca vitripennis]|nr:hypothetical protein J6590_092793 [Homalodisca vitripennis]KAG8323016.1 hypothetical protein J6590_013010 [Homalodisca vitripennis]